MKFDVAKSESTVIQIVPFNSQKKRGGVAVKRVSISPSLLVTTGIVLLHRMSLSFYFLYLLTHTIIFLLYIALTLMLLLFGLFSLSNPNVLAE